MHSMPDTVQSLKPRTFAHDAQEWQCVENVDLASEMHHLTWDDFDELETERVGASDAFAGNKIVALMSSQ